MKRLFPLLGAALLALFSTSCLEHSATLRVNKDGSATLTEETVMSAEASAMMAQMGGGGGKDPTKQFADKAKAEATATKMGEGVTVEKVEAVEKADGRMGGRVTYKIADINKVKFEFGSAMTEAGKSMAPPGAEEKAKENTPLSFAFADGVLTLNNPQPKEEGGEKIPAEEIEEPDPQSLAMAQQMFKDMRMTFKIEAPSGIEETNATHVSGNTVTIIDVEFGKLMSDAATFKKLQALKDASPTETAAAFKDIDGIKVETKDQVTVKVK